MAGPIRPQRDLKVQPPRPPNAWILYRSHQFKQIRENNVRLPQASVSKIISEMWKHETEPVRRRFEQEAEARKIQHQELYPDYRFCPKKKEPKRGGKKSKASEPAPTNGDDDAAKVEEHEDASLPAPAYPQMSYMHAQPQSQPPVAAYHPNMVMPQPFMIPYLPEAHGPGGGPSPPISTTPSPVSRGGSGSPLQPPSVISSSSSSAQRSLSAESQASSSSSQLPANPTYPPAPNPHYPPPNPYAALPLSTILFQRHTSGELPPASPWIQLRSAENTMTPVPAWNDIQTYPPASIPASSVEAANLNLAIPQPRSHAAMEQATSSSSSLDPLQGVLSMTDESGVFSLSNIETSSFLTHPEGDLEVAMGPQAEVAETCSDDIFTDFDFADFQRQMDSLTAGGSSSTTVTPCSLPEDLQSLFYTPNNPELEAYTAAQQRQPSGCPQDMMSYFNFEDIEGSTEDTAPAEPSVLVPTPVGSQQAYFQDTQVAPAVPIFTQMTNTPAVALSGNSYVPPAGAIYSSTRRVGGTWKPSFIVPAPQIDESTASWSF